MAQQIACAAGRRVRIFFEDEARFGRMTTPRACWAPAPLRPRVGQQQVREYINAWLTVSPRDGATVWDTSLHCDSLTTGRHLRQVAATFPREWLVVIMDRAGWHVARDLVLPARMRLLWLPAYSPELDPVENLWDHLRENVFGNVVLDSLVEVEARLQGALEGLKDRPDTVRSITLHRWIWDALEPFGNRIV